MRKPVVLAMLATALLLLTACNSDEPRLAAPAEDNPSTTVATPQPNEPTQDETTPPPATTLPGQPISVSDFDESLPNGFTRYTANTRPGYANYSNGVVRVEVEALESDGFFVNADGSTLYSVSFTISNNGPGTANLNVGLTLSKIEAYAIVITGSTDSYTPALATFLYELMEGISGEADTALGLSSESIQELSRTQTWLDGTLLSIFGISVEGPEQQVVNAAFWNNMFVERADYDFTDGPIIPLSNDVAQKVADAIIRDFS